MRKKRQNKIPERTNEDIQKQQKKKKKLFPIAVFYVGKLWCSSLYQFNATGIARAKKSGSPSCITYPAPRQNSTLFSTS
jgi:hypothetical protein